MLCLAIFSSNKTDGSALSPGEPINAVALFGSVEVDLTGAPRELEATVLALFGSVKLRIREDEEVMLGGFSLFGSRQLDPPALPRTGDKSAGGISDDDDRLPIELNAYSLFGSIIIKRGPSFLRRIKQSLKLKPDFSD